LKALIIDVIFLDFEMPGSDGSMEKFPWRPRLHLEKTPA
jgi:hypothetical protein